MQQTYILYWQQTMRNSTKLEFFNTFKNDYTPSCYLIKFQGLIDFALFVHLIKLKTNLTFLYTAINTLF